MELSPNEAERAERDQIIARVIECIHGGTTITLPAFDPDKPAEAGPFGGAVGEFRYQLEGEEDLLHLIVTRIDATELGPVEGHQVAGFVLEGVPEALVWFKPGEFSLHFYLGHEALLPPKSPVDTPAHLEE